MTEINENDAANLSTLIYGRNLPEIIGNPKGNYTVGDLIQQIKEKPSEIMIDDKVGGEMSLEEYMCIVEQIEQSEMLMSMEIVGFVDEVDTDFRAFTLVDPDGEVKPTIIFRGTAGDYQWADNFAGLFSSRTPVQMRAQQYVVNSGYDHVVTAGHSKGGNMAAAVAYMLPEGMVDRAYSFDGQGVSDPFLDSIPESRQENALNRVHNINEYRDIVNRLLNPTGRYSNTKHIDSGILFDDTEFATADLAKNLKMTIFHAHKPNYLTMPGATERDTAYHPMDLYDWPNDLTNFADDYAGFRGPMLWIGRNAAEVFYTDDSMTEWSEDMWNAVFDAEKVYASINKNRDKKIRARLAELTGVNMKKKLLIQPEGSLVVEGAVITCQYCSGVGSLEVTEERADLIQGKRVAVKTDNKEENIQMGLLECARIDWSEGRPEPRSCVPEICHEWLLTDADKLRGPRQEEAVLKKSVLGCLRGGMIEIVHNGQMTGEDAGEVIRESKREKSEETKYGEFADLVRAAKSIPLWANLKDQFTSSVAITKWVGRRVEDAREAVQDWINEIESSPSQAYENFINYLIEQKLRQIIK